MYPHRIRLRGPWTCEPQFRFGPDGRLTTVDIPPAFRMTMPGRWRDAGLGDFRGQVRFVRPFGYPGRIDEFERVWLTFEDAAGHASATLNGTPLGAWEGAAEFEVTALLQTRNTLIVEVTSTTPDGGLCGEVALEVRVTAFLKDVAVHVDDVLKVTGTIAGSADRPLDLYLLAAGQCLAHATVLAGQPFEIAAELPTRPFSLRVELVDAATIWYVIQRTVPLAQSNDPGETS